MTVTTVQTSFAAGEISPSFWGHTDHVKFKVGCSTLRNMFVSIRGGAYSRGGLKFCGQCKQVASASSVPPRIITNQFRINQSYILEFGDGYLRFIANGGYITEGPESISNATNAATCVLTLLGHTFVNGDWVFVTGVTGMTELNGGTYIVAAATVNTISLLDTLGHPVDSRNFNVYFGQGLASRIYTVVTPYAASDLPYLKFTQAADLMSLALSNPAAATEYAPQDLKRLAGNNWTISPTSFTSSIAAPVGCTAVASAAPSGVLPSAQYAFCATAIDALTGQESVASPVVYVSSVDISLTTGSIALSCNAVTGAGEYRFYKAPAAVYVNGAAAQTVPVGSAFGLIGTSAGPSMRDDNIVPDFTTTPPLHSNPFARGQLLFIRPDAGGAGYVQSTTIVTLVTATGSGAVILPVVIGGVLAAYIVVNPGQNYLPGDPLSIVDSSGGVGAHGTTTIGPQTGTYPGVVAYFQQRRGFADSLNNPDTYVFSQTGAQANFDASNPPIASDAVTGTPWAQQINGVQWMVTVPAGLLIYTGLDAWLLSGAGGPATAIAPASQNATAQESSGFSATVPPIKVVYQILAVDAFGYQVSALNYNYFTNTYAGDDLTTLANHLFDGHQIVQWVWSKKPYKILWAVRDDGVLLSLTYLKEQEVVAWARHDTNGQVVSIAVASEQPVDAVYVVVKRFIAGKSAYAYYTERMDNRLWTNAEAAWCVDAGVSLPQYQPPATLTASAASGTGVVFTSSAISTFNGSNAPPGAVIRMGGGKATVTAILSDTQLRADVTRALATVPNDPANSPLPAPPGSWSVTVPVQQLGGLGHLEGMTVTGLADGAVITPTIVRNGSITLSVPATAVIIGLGFQAQVQSLHLLQDGAQIQGKRKNVIAVTVRLEKSRGVKLGSDQPNASAQESGANVPWGLPPYGKMILIPEPQNQLGPSDSLPLFTGDHRIPIDGDFNLMGWSSAPGMVAAQQDFPLPMQVLAFIPEFEVGDEDAP